jgi:hypothetical protein
LEKLLAIKELKTQWDLVAYAGGDAFELSSKAVAVVSSERGLVDIFS